LLCCLRPNTGAERFTRRDLGVAGPNRPAGAHRPMKTGDALWCRGERTRSARTPAEGTLSMKRDEEEAIIRRLNAVERRIPVDVFPRLGRWRWYINILKRVMDSLEASEEPSVRCLEVTRNMFQRWRARVAADLAAAQAGLDGLRLELEQGGHAEDAAHARLAIQKIGRARRAERVPAELLEELDDLHEYLLGTLMFG